jgi:outer membrane receptor for ferric coprogen and ferric-rhodotorulic acid
VRSRSWQRPLSRRSNTAPSGQTGPLEQSAEVNTNKDVTPTDETTTNSNDIVITAQGRAQVLEDVPIAVSAVSAESLQNSGASDIRQLNQLAPSLLVSSTGTEANGSARIRGIGTVGDNPGLESSVAVFIDGVYRSRTGVGLNELGEIERVEVLRGPQGTLFGRNASAGLFNIISKKPNLNEFEGFAEGDLRQLQHVALVRRPLRPDRQERPRLPDRQRLPEARRLLPRDQSGRSREPGQRPRPLLRSRPIALRAERPDQGPADRRLHQAQRELLRRRLCR